METKELIGIAAGICTAVSLVPQLVKSVREKQVEGVSVFLFLVLLAGNSLWVVYGVMLKDWPIIVTNSFSVTMDVVMLVLKFWYGRGKR